MRPWTVLPHAPIEKVADNLWIVEGTLPKGKMNRRMAIARLADGRLVFHNAIPLTDEAMRDVEAWGRPAILLVTNGYHRLDVHAWKVRYPELKVLCPAAHHARVAKAVAVDGHYDAFPADPAVRLEVLDGSKIGEGVLVVTSGARTSLAFADTLMNIPDGPGLDIFLFKLLGSVGDLRVTWIARTFIVNDRRALRAHLARLADLPGLSRLIVTHGRDVTDGVPDALRKAAARL